MMCVEPSCKKRFFSFFSPSSYFLNLFFYFFARGRTLQCRAGAAKVSAAPSPCPQCSSAPQLAVTMQGMQGTQAAAPGQGLCLLPPLQQHGKCCCGLSSPLDQAVMSLTFPLALLRTQLQLHMVLFWAQVLTVSFTWGLFLVSRKRKQPD